MIQGRTLAVRSTIMGRPADAGSRTVHLKQGNEILDCGSTVEIGEELDIEISSTEGKYLIELIGANVEGGQD